MGIKNKRAAFLDNYQIAVKNFIDLVTSAFVIWLGSYYILNSQFSIGELITYNSLLGFFTSPLQNIVNLQVKLQSAEVASKRLNEIFSINKEQDESSQINIYDIKQQISVTNLSFSYNLKNMALQGIDFTLKKGQKVAIVGMSGSGKSTFAKLLVKFFKGSAGTIKYDSYDIDTITNTSLRNFVNYVPQDTYFFNGTIFENLTFGNSQCIENDRLIEACKKAEIYDFIASLPLQF